MPKATADSTPEELARRCLNQTGGEYERARRMARLAWGDSREIVNALDQWENEESVS